MHKSSYFAPFPSQDSHIVRLVCDEVKQEEELVKELERGTGAGEQQFFLADPGWSINVFISKDKKTTFSSPTGSSIPLVIVTVDKNLFG